jgi:hypothetical protein
MLFFPRLNLNNLSQKPIIKILASNETLWPNLEPLRECGDRIAEDTTKIVCAHRLRYFLALLSFKRVKKVRVGLA